MPQAESLAPYNRPDRQADMWSSPLRAGSLARSRYGEIRRLSDLSVRPSDDSIVNDIRVDSRDHSRMVPTMFDNSPSHAWRRRSIRHWAYSGIAAIAGFLVN
jgi:hypothetical protein